MKPACRYGDSDGGHRAARQYVWGLYLDELLLYDFDADSDGDFDAIDEENGDERYYCLQDFIYSTAAVIDSSGTVLERCDYEPYGSPTFWTPDYTDTRAETAVHNHFLFTGQLYDPETGLYHYKARALHPSLGRFLQRDFSNHRDTPYLPLPASSHVDNMNLHEYGGSHPAAGVDPSGRRKLVLKYYNNGIDNVRWIDRMWEDFPRLAATVADLVAYAKSANGWYVDREGSCANCIDAIIIVGHSGVAGVAGLGTNEFMAGGDFSDRDIHGMSTIENRFRTLRPYMCKTGLIEIRACNAGAGEAGTRLVLSLARALNVKAVAYTESFRFGLSDLAAIKIGYPDGRIETKGTPHADQGKKRRKKRRQVGHR